MLRHEWTLQRERRIRRDPGEAQRVAYTQDRSRTGFGLDLPEGVKPGELLRIRLRDIDGEIDMDALARVVWCKSLSSGRARAGLAMLRESGKRPMMRARAKPSAESSREITSLA